MGVVYIEYGLVVGNEIDTGSLCDNGGYAYVLSMDLVADWKRADV